MMQKLGRSPRRLIDLKERLMLVQAEDSIAYKDYANPGGGLHVNGPTFYENVYLQQFNSYQEAIDFIDSELESL